jgi:hypothetical protein
MSKLIMCTNNECLLREYCFRYRKIPTTQQQYFPDHPSYDPMNCSSFIHLKKSDKIRHISICDQYAKTVITTDKEID